jgi:mono/diheme cytochrome c family protein
MYHGIVQESNWTRKGSYLRKKIEQYAFDKVVDHGRIWRLVHDSKKPDFTKPRMLNETPAQLVAHLSHPNGWWRDSAQRTLVLRQDTSVVPALTELARNGSSLVGRFHALWTLEGLGKLDPVLVRDLLKDASPQLRVQAIRASESLTKAGDTSFDADVRAALKDGDANVVIQAMLTLNLRGVKEIGDQILRPPSFTGGGGGFRLNSPEQVAVMQKGQGVYTELCYSCHGQDGNGEPLAGAPAGTTMAPPLAGSPRVLAHKEYVIKTVLHGLTGPIDGATYSNVMIPMGDNSDEWIAAIATFVRNSFGNRASFVHPADVARVRAKTKAHAGLWTVEELDATIPSQIVPHEGWKATASVNAANAPQAVAGLLPPVNGRPAGGQWSTGARQQAGMWFMVDMAAPATVAEIQFDSQNTFGGGPRPAPPAGAASGAPPAAGAPAGPRPAAPAAPAGPPTGVATYPRAYEVHVSLDGQQWGTPVATGKGTPGSTTIVLAQPVRARYLRITQTATDETAPAWSVARLQIYGPAAPGPITRPSAP